MATPHLKGYVLQLLHARGRLWDYEVIQAVATDYGLPGPYWAGTVRLTLIDLYACGLITELQAAVDPTKSDGEERILFQYELNEFGLDRMVQSGLLEGAR